MMNELFHPGAALKVEIITETNLIRSYNTIIEDLEHNFLVLQAPFDNGIPVYVEEGRELTLRREIEEDQKAYVTNVFVIENRPGKVPLLVCGKPKEFKKTSLRRYARFDIDLFCECSTEYDHLPGRVTNISLSGCFVEIAKDAPLTEGTNIQTAIDIPGEYELTFSGEIVRTYDVSDDRKIGLALDIREISMEMKEVLKNYLFQCQLLN